MKGKRKMKKTACVAISLLALSAAAVKMSDAVPKGWVEDFEAAKKAAAAEGKLVFLAFSGSDWCGWCVKLDQEVYSQSDFIRKAKRDFVLTMIDNPRDQNRLSPLAQRQNRELTTQFGVRGFPSGVVCSADGKEIERISGYVKGGPDAYLERMKEIAKKAGHKTPAAGRNNDSDDFFFSWGVPMGGLIQQAGNTEPEAVKKLIEKKIVANKKAIEKIMVEMRKMPSVKTESDAKRALARFESAVKAYHNVYVSGYGKWPLKDWEVVGEMANTVKASIAALNDVISKAASEPAKAVYGKRLEEFQSRHDKLKKHYEEMCDKALGASL